MRGLGCFPLALPRLSFPFSTEFPGPQKVLVRRDLHKAMPNKPLGKAGCGRGGLQSQHAGGSSALFSVSAMHTVARSNLEEGRFTSFYTSQSQSIDEGSQDRN